MLPVQLFYWRNKVNLDNKQKNINNHLLAFYDKFVIRLFYDVFYRTH
jgi:hypothetical protein